MSNADYLVDELCAQLRAIDRMPRAVALFAAILRCSGAPPVLLPLLAEPARLAVRSLAITARYCTGLPCWTEGLRLALACTFTCQPFCSAVHDARAAGSKDDDWWVNMAWTRSKHAP